MTCTLFVVSFPTPGWSNTSALQLFRPDAESLAVAGLRNKAVFFFFFCSLVGQLESENVDLHTYNRTRLIGDVSCKSGQPFRSWLGAIHPGLLSGVLSHPHSPIGNMRSLKVDVSYFPRDK